MLKISHQTAAAIAVAFAWDARVCYRLNKRNADLKDALTNVCEENAALIEEMGYMCHLLNENGIQLCEFDLIAMPHVKLQHVEQ